jgi:hypothetical protein
LLAERLAAVPRHVTAIDSDPAALQRSAARLASIDNADVRLVDFANYQPGARRFDLITFVASIHHMDTAAALRKARAMLAPGGEIAVVGLSANKTVADWAWSAASVPFARFGSWLHGETRNIGVPVTERAKAFVKSARSPPIWCPTRRFGGASITATCFGSDQPEASRIRRPATSVVRMTTPVSHNFVCYRAAPVIAT